MRHRRFVPTIVFFFTIVLACFALRGAIAQTQSSSQFKNVNPSTEVLVGETKSSNYQISASVGPFTGESQSGSFLVEWGAQGAAGSAPAPPPTPPPVIGGGGGGGGGSPIEDAFPPAPTTSTVDELPRPSLITRRWTYLNTTRIFGQRGVEGAEIFVNHSSQGVIYPTLLTWERLMPLGLGNNDLYVQSRFDDRMSGIVHGIVRRRLVGDVDDSQRVDDVDLSLFTRHWNAYDERSDFNEDGRIDDVDLSLLASHWNRSF